MLWNIAAVMAFQCTEDSSFFTNWRLHFVSFGQELALFINLSNAIYIPLSQASSLVMWEAVHCESDSNVLPNQVSRSPAGQPGSPVVGWSQIGPQRMQICFACEQFSEQTVWAYFLVKRPGLQACWFRRGITPYWMSTVLRTEGQEE